MYSKVHHMVVFTTKKTLHERFTPKSERSVFLLNNGDSSRLNDRNDSATFNINDKKNTLVSDGMEIDYICPTYNQNSIEEDEEKAKVLLNLPAKREANNWNPTNFKSRYRTNSFANLIDLTGSESTWNDQFHVKKRFFPFKSRPQRFDSRLPFRGVRRNYGTNRRFPVYNDRYKRPNFQNSDFCRSYRYIRPFSYRWGRGRSIITKEQLDDEIDKYMAEVLLHPPYYKSDKEDSNENYLDETEIFLKTCDNE